MASLYKSVGYVKKVDGFYILLDQKIAFTPLENPLCLPNEKLAQAIAEEWRAQEKKIRKETMPLTQFACVAIDLITEKRSAVCEEIAGYAETDLICYRAGNIPALQITQESLLNPLLSWAEHRFAIELKTTDGFMPIQQPVANKLKIRTILSEYDKWKLAVIAIITKPMSSIILALALTEGHINAEDAFTLSHLEEAYETEQWGEDKEKQLSLKKIKTEIHAAERFLSLL
jgi:chaperone required for assembly of F1-ATPase